MFRRAPNSYVNRVNTSSWLSLGLVVLMTACRSTTTPEEKKTPKMETLTLPGAAPFDPQTAKKLREALADKGKSYVPRTHHKSPDGVPKYINRLIFETSPYLLQHAHNPVNWYAWGPEAFAYAMAHDLPILLSVGYSTCHWCHVMERESFEDEEIAGYINANFVAIKVDREERPDVDSVYMTAVQLMTGRGGWPMTVVMSPDKIPFFGGTYFPARDGDRGTRIGFFTLLNRLKTAYTNDREKLKSTGKRLAEAIQKSNAQAAPEELPGHEALHLAAEALTSRFDPQHGGFGRAPKFPRPTTYGLLLRYYRRTGDGNALQMVTRSVEKMMFGGIYDHVGGGFHRYSTDARWLVPHFEKMLYDNAQLVGLLIETYQVTADQRFASVARETLDYVLKEMTSPEGGFYSATDADSEGEEGKFFVWSQKEIDALLGEDAKAIASFYNVTEGGNFEGHNILNRTQPLPVVAKSFSMSEEAFSKKLQQAKQKLYDARKKRIPPLLDDKILTEWNGQMISAFARAAFALDEPRYQKAAERAADFVWEKLQKDGRLLRAYRNKQAKHNAVLEDYAFQIAGLLDLFEVTGAPKWLERALVLQRTLEKHFWDAKNGAFFGTADDGEPLLVREKPSYDGAQPSGNSAAALNLLRLSELTTQTKYRELAEKTLIAFGENLNRGAMSNPMMGMALEFYHDRPKEVVLVTSPGDKGEALRAVLRRSFLPNRALVQVSQQDVESLQKLVPLVEQKRAMNFKATAYVCLGQVCKKPTSDPKELQKQLTEVEPLKAKTK